MFASAFIISAVKLLEKLNIFLECLLDQSLAALFKNFASAEVFLFLLSCTFLTWMIKIHVDDFCFCCIYLWRSLTFKELLNL